MNSSVDYAGGTVQGGTGGLAGKLRGLLKNRHAMDAATTFAVRMVSAFLGYGLQIYLARMMNLADYGIYATLWTWLIVANHISVLGFSESAIRFVPRYTCRKRHDWALGFLQTGFSFVLAGAFGIAWLIFTGLYLLSGAVPDAWLIAIAVLAMGLPVMALDLYVEGVSRSFGWYLLTIIPQYIARPILTALGITLLWFAGFSVSAAMVLAVAACATALALIVQALILRHRIKKLFGDAKAAPRQKFWVKASLPLAIVVACEEVFFWSDLLILGFMVESEQVSIYFAAIRCMSLALFIHYAFMLVTARKFSLAKAEGDREQLQEKVTQGTNWTFWLTVPAVILTLVAGYPLLHLFGPAFVAGFPIMMVMGVGLTLRAAVGQSVDLLNVLGHQRTNLVAAVGGVASNIILSLILVPHFGVMGAAMGTAVTYALRSAFLTVAVWKLAGIWILPGGLPPRLSRVTAR